METLTELFNRYDLPYISLHQIRHGEIYDRVNNKFVYLDMSEKLLHKICNMFASVISNGPDVPIFSDLILKYVGPNYSIFSRLIIERNKYGKFTPQYVAGQMYDYEINELKNLFKNHIKL